MEEEHQNESENYEFHQRRRSQKKVNEFLLTHFQS